MLHNYKMNRAMWLGNLGSLKNLQHKQFSLDDFLARS